MSDEVTNMKECPFCAEDVKINAKKCKYCGETIDVALRAAEEAKQSNNNPNVFMNAGGGGASSSSASAAASGGGQFMRRNFPHGWHILGTILTLGWWLPVWILMYIFRNKNYYN